MSMMIAAGALLLLAVMYGIEKVRKGRKRMDKFEPYEIGELELEKGDMLECTESYGEFTQGYNYIVRVEFGGALVVWNDEKKPVLAFGLDPRKFRVVEKNVDGTVD